MKVAVLIVFLSAILSGVFAAEGQSQPSSWVPGTSYYATETQIGDRLERTYDFAYCSGIKRFGYKPGHFFNDRFRVFDCMTERDDTSCASVRITTIKARRNGSWRMKVIRPGSCF